ncbi:MAG: Uncharacterized protein Greene041679_549 [Parcubacteria group bacterium Greene0416_79]|nr:MAG: Uncharacterized protein Greene041679_549 [Parcubacteria group bacterium Greene0416_79]
MPIQLQTSFVSKQPAMMAPHMGGRSRTVSWFGIISIFVFLAAAALAGAVFFYQRYLVGEIAGMDAKLVETRRSFEPEFVDVAERLNRRILSAKALLSAHRSLSPLFDLLEKKTLTSVRFQNFSFSAEKEGVTLLSMTGQAKSFNAVALQSDIFGEEHYFKNPVFSNFNLNEQGDVLFQFKAEIDPGLLGYSEHMTSASQEGGARATTSVESFE